MDICLGIVRLQEQHLGDQCVSDLIVDIGPQEDDAVFEQTTVDIVHSFFATGLFDDIRDHWHGFSSNYLSLG